MLASGRVHFWQGGSLWIGSGQGRTQWHAHHAHQITLPFAGTCRFRSEDDSAGAEFSGAFVHSERPHQLEMEPTGVAQLFVEPETAEGQALQRRFAAQGGVAHVPEPERAALVELLMSAHGANANAQAMVATGRAAIAVLAGTPSADAELDRRIARALEFIRAGIRGTVKLSDVAAAAALSPGRFRHLFVQETGAALRTYVLWLRINIAIERSMAGGSWTDAAHDAGFADSAHLSRTFKRMFGINPATLVRAERTASAAATPPPRRHADR
jgi:AraC-like DNA-binding protein